jgi:hypothetical protein
MFNEYAQELNKIAVGYLTAQATAAVNYEDAERSYYKYKRPNGVWHNPDPEAVVLAAKSELEYNRAKEEWNRMKNGSYDETKRNIAKVRANLEEALAVHYTPNPASVDPNLLAILDSGMLKVDEYERLYEKMAKEDNETMVRLIGAAAGEAAADMGDAEHLTQEERRQRGRLLAIKEAAKRGKSENYLAAFDEIVEAFNIFARSPAMYSRWDSMVGEKVKNF